MKSPMAKVAIIAVVCAAVTIAVLVLAVKGAHRESCEVCVSFGGLTECREAAGRTREEAVKTAIDNACAFLASGMTDSVSCQNTPPTRVTCAP